MVTEKWDTQDGSVRWTVGVWQNVRVKQSCIFFIFLNVEQSLVTDIHNQIIQVIEFRIATMYICNNVTFSAPKIQRNKTKGPDFGGFCTIWWWLEYNFIIISRYKKNKGSEGQKP